jgi:hypothetical protein
VDEGVCIRIWTRDTIPERFRHLAVLHDDGDAAHNTTFVAHVPAAMLADRTYWLCNGESGTDGWLREGELGLFGTNCIEAVPHPDGDGFLIVGSGL